MAVAARRSDIACDRMGFDPLDKDTCLGFDEDDEPCNQRVSIQARRLVCTMVGQGAHLFHDSGELRGILTEAASILFCCVEHENVEELVHNWLTVWKIKEDDDRKIVDLMKQHIRERNPPDKSWEVGFENIMYQIVRSDVPAEDKLANAKHAIFEDNMVSEMYQSGKRARTGSVLSRLPGFPPRLRSAAPRRNDGHPLAQPLRRIPSMISIKKGIEQQNLHQSKDEASQVEWQDSTLSPVMSSHEQELEPLTDMMEMAGSQKRKTALSGVRGSIIKAVTQPFSSLTTTSIPESSSTPSKAKSYYSTSTDTLVPAIQPPPYKVIPGPAQTRPKLTINTAPDTAEPEVEVDTEPGSSGTRATRWSAITGKITSPWSATSISIPTPVTPVDCDFCTLTYDADNPREGFVCDFCSNLLHFACYEEWNWANVNMRRMTTCPYCREYIEPPQWRSGRPPQGVRR